ncbi:MAG: S-layer homology domain-containing protein, partial [Chloroflexia bacterium]
MSNKPGLAHRSFLLPLLVLLAVAALALGVAPRYPTSRSDSPIAWSEEVGGAPFRDLIGAFQPESVTFGPNIRANQDTSGFGQHEPSLAMSRVNTNTVIVASKDYRQGNIKRVWIDGSTDGGLTWPVQLHMPNLPTTENESDPVVIARDDGRIYVACLTTGNNGLFITWTDNNGQTWQPSVPIVQNQGGLQDKEWIAIDNKPTSPYYHRMYVTYVPFSGPYNGRAVEQHSTDGGLTWSTVQPIGPFNTEYNYPVVASNGTVYDFMMQNWGGGQTGTILMTKSTNGGVTWSATTSVAIADQPDSPIRPADTFRFFAILSAAVDPNNGHLYVAWTDNRNFNTNGTDVMYVKSTDGGATWSPQPIRLSHDPTGLVRDHHTPVITIGADSRIHAFWMDRRLDPSNRFFHEWYSSSTDGGATWLPDVQVSDIPQDLNIGFPPGSGNAAGDYWGIDTYLDTVYVAWNDTRFGNEQDIYVSRGYISSASGGTPTATPPTTSTPTRTLTPTNPPADSTPTSTFTRTPTNIPANTSTRTLTPTTAPTQTPGGPSATPEPTNTSTNTPSTSATATGTSLTLSPTPTGTPGPECAPQWQPVANSIAGNLVGVASVSHNDAWAVGDGGIFRWNGTSWNAVPFPTPNPPGCCITLTGVSAHHANDVWVAGYYSASPDILTVVYHWDGVAWTIIPRISMAGDNTPSGLVISKVYDIAAVGPDEAFAVGIAEVFEPRASTSTQISLIYHCTTNGCSYTGGSNSGLDGVAGSAPNDVWAVGFGGILHWDGIFWQGISAPAIGGKDVTVIAPNDVWAVGRDGTIHWDGSSWTQMSDTDDFDNVLGVSGIASNDVWAVSARTTQGNNIHHWDGAQWSEVLSTDLDLFGVSALATDDVWAVGGGLGAANAYITRYRWPTEYFEDVPPGSTFHPHIQELRCRGIVNGYPCGSAGEPCVPPDNRPYFRPQNNVTRGQLSKIVVLSAGFELIPNIATFE